jgi:hypothetical protein
LSFAKDGIRHPVVWGVGLVILLAVGGYFLGRWDAPDRSDALVSSLMDGVKAYHKQNTELTERLQKVAKDLQASEGRERKLASARTPTPAMVPAACAPWERNLSLCDQQVFELRTQVEAAGRLEAMRTAGRSVDSARIDSLERALRKCAGKDRILGIKLPSRKTSLLAGALAGGGACLLLTK